MAMTKQDYSDRIDELNALLERVEIGQGEYESEMDANNTAYGVSVSKWPCP
jgi:hypothetical protein